MCVGSLLEVLRKPDKIILDFMLQPKLRHLCAQYPNQIISKSHRGHIKDLAFSAEQAFFFFFWTYKPGYTNKENNSQICSGTTPVLFWSSRWLTPAQSAPHSDPSRVSSAGLKHNYQGRFDCGMRPKFLSDINNINVYIREHPDLNLSVISVCAFKKKKNKKTPRNF